MAVKLRREMKAQSIVWKELHGDNVVGAEDDGRWGGEEKRGLDGDIVEERC